MTFFKAKTTQSSTELNQKNYQSLLIALMAVIIPHLFYMPVLVSIIIAGVLLVWQFLVWKKGNLKATQTKLIQYGTVFLCLGLIYLNFNTFFGVDAGCAALVVILLGKAFEVKTYRDAIIQINFALFVLATLFLYGQEIYLAIFVFIAVLACFFSLYQLQSYNASYEEVLSQDVSSKSLKQQALKTVARLIFLAVPLMVLLFLFFPRFPPLWSIPQPSHQAKTGMSDEMSPGDIVQLSQSSELAFRVVFDDFNQMPAKQNLYWRAIVLEQFDGVTWRQHPRSKFSPMIRIPRDQDVGIPEWYSASNGSTNLLPYQLIYEPNYQLWAYSLEHSVAKQRIGLKPDLTLQFDMELGARRSVNLWHISPHPYANIELDSYSERINTYLENDTLNPKSQQFALEMKQKFPEPERYAQAILNWIRAESFSYTLSPPLLKNDRIDDFLFRTRAGFCEHYSSAFVNLMRMANIPARVVTGYQGGQWAPDKKSWEVRQLDAHAWAEIWVEGKGWVRIDPTAAVAPERVELGMQSYSQQNEEFWGDADGSLWNYQRSQWMTQTHIWVDYMNYQWHSKVVGFDRENQQNWLHKISIKNFSQQLLVLLGGFFAFIGFMVWWLSLQQKVKLSHLDQALLRLSKHLEKYGLARTENEPVLTWFNRVNDSSYEHDAMNEIIHLYTQHVYIQKLNLKELKRLEKLILKYTHK